VYNIFGLLYFLNKLSKDWVGSSSYFNTLTRPPPPPPPLCASMFT
jgi:hypothetical protein